MVQDIHLCRNVSTTLLSRPEHHLTVYTQILPSACIHPWHERTLERYPSLNSEHLVMFSFIYSFCRFSFYIPFDAHLRGLHGDDYSALFDHVTLHADNKCANDYGRCPLHHGVPASPLAIKLFAVFSASFVYGPRYDRKSGQASARWVGSDSRKKSSVDGGLWCDISYCNTLPVPYHEGRGNAQLGRMARVTSMHRSPLPASHLELYLPRHPLGSTDLLSTVPFGIWLSQSNLASSNRPSEPPNASSMDIHVRRGVLRLYRRCRRRGPRFGRIHPLPCSVAPSLRLAE